MSIVSESNPWCDITSAENALGIDSQPLTTASPRAHISFSLLALTWRLPSAAPVGPGSRQAEMILLGGGLRPPPEDRLRTSGGASSDDGGWRCGDGPGRATGPARRPWPRRRSGGRR